MKKLTLESLTLKRLQDSLVLIILITIIIICSFVVPRFLTIRNISSLLGQISSLGLMMLGELIVILVAGIDLSVGSVMGFSACLMCGLIVLNGVPIIIAIFAALLSGAIAGLISGIAVGYFRVSPFIATLSVMGIYRGLTLVYTGRSAISGLPLFFLEVGSKEILGLSMLTFIFFIIAGMIHFILKYTRLGKHIYAVGGNETAAYVAGISVTRVKIIAYMTSGTLSALAGIFMAARLISAQPLMGLGWELRVITGVVFGGASLFGGVGNIINTIFGLFVVEIVGNAMNLLSILKYTQEIVIGIVLIIALVLFQIRNKKTLRRRGDYVKTKN